ncbi:MAG TPA: LysE family transporter [Anaerolineae bacterium]|nr:LysE family transporter [Anaerolineae bacterium]
MFSLITFGIFMGILFAAPPGIVTAETLRRGVARGFPAALSVQLGSLIGDATYCLLALAGVAVLVQNPITQRVLGIVSVLFLIYLTISGIRAELKSAPTSNPLMVLPTASRSAFLTGMFLSLTNPWAIGFWLSLGGTLASDGAMESGNTMAVFFTSFFGACLVYAFVMAFLVGVTRRAIPPKIGKWISISCSLVIGLVAIGVGIQVIQLFL